MSNQIKSIDEIYNAFKKICDYFEAESKQKDDYDTETAFNSNNITYEVIYKPVDCDDCEEDDDCVYNNYSIHKFDNIAETESYLSSEVGAIIFEDLRAYYDGNIKRDQNNITHRDIAELLERLMNGIPVRFYSDNRGWMQLEVKAIISKAGISALTH